MLKTTTENKFIIDLYLSGSQIQEERAFVQQDRTG
jgi:hypothetical protein